MSIHKRQTKNGTVYDVRWREGTKNRGLTFPTRDEAQEFEVERRRRERLGAHAPGEPSTMRLEDFLVRWLTNGNFAGTTLRSRGPMIDKWIVPYIGDVQLRDLGRMQVREFRATIMRDGSRPTNTNNVLRVLSAALGTAADDGLIPANPCERLGRVRQPKPVRRAHPPAVTKAMLAALPEGRDRFIGHLMLHSGLRPAEVVALRWADVNLNTRHLWIHESVQDRQQEPVKNELPRSIPYEAALHKTLVSWHAATGGHPADTVVCGKRGGFLNWKMWTRNVWGDARLVAAKKGVPADIVPYELRHTYASTLIIVRRLDLLEVARRMGHSARVTLDHYAHLYAQVQMPAGRTSRQARAA